MPRRTSNNKGEKSWYKVDSKKGIYYTNVIGHKTHRFVVKKDGKPNPIHLLETIEKLEEEHGKFGSVEGIDGVYTVSIKRKENEVTLPSGIYNFMKEDYSTGDPERLVPVDFRTDQYIKLPNSKSDEIVKELKIFLDSEDLYKELNCIFKSGFLLYGKPGEGKCLAKGTEVLTYDGKIVKVEDVRENDLLMGDDNTPRLVKGITKGTEEMFKVTQRGYGSYVVNKSHILSLKESGGEGFIKGKIRDISIDDYLNLPNYKKHHLKGYFCGADFKLGEELPIPPYLLGYWLGDGTTSKPEITTMDKEIVEEFESYSRKNNLTLNKHTPSGKAFCYYMGVPNHRGLENRAKDCNIFTKGLRQLNVYENKHIPNLALRQCRENKMELLAGLIDSDGNTNRCSYDYSSTIKELACGVATLGRSLGFRCTVKSRVTKDQNGTKCNSFRVRISGQGVDKIPVRIPRKKVPERKIKKDHTVFGLNINSIGQGEYFGFTVDKNGRFLLGDFTVTHNTALLRSIVREELPKDCIVININDVLPDSQFLSTIKQTLNDRLKIFILEEFTHFTKDPYDMEAALTFLDGENSINKSVIFATTNYPEVLPGNIVERHSRFDHLYEITSPDANSRKLLLDYYMGKEVTEEEIKLTQDLSSDSIKNLCILARKKKISIKEASDKVKQHLKVAKDNFRKVGKLGI